MKRIIDIINEISKEPSTNNKVQLLKNQVDNEIFKRVLYLTYSPRIKFYIKEIPQYDTSRNSNLSLPDCLDKLEHLYNRKVTGHDAINFLKLMLEECVDSSVCDVIKLIINKDLKIGISSALINKAFKNLIEETPYMGCRPYSADLIHKMFLNGKSALSEVKADGRYVNIIIKNDIFEMVSRQGEPSSIYHESKISKEILELSKNSNTNNIVLNGELIIPNINRLTSNGIIASVIDITSKLNNGEHDEANKSIIKLKKKHDVDFYEIVNDIKMVCWDIISIDEYFNGISETPRYKRLLQVLNLIEFAKLESIIPVEFKKINSFSEAIEHLNEMLKRGEEGTVVKSIDGIWKDGKHPFQVKCKLEMDLDLKIVSFNYGEKGTKNEHVISSINVESSDGILKASCQGLKEDEMEYITNNQDSLYGKIVKVKCNGLSENSNGGKSLFYPTFIEIRDDKTEANSYQECVEIENMNKGLK